MILKYINKPLDEMTVKELRREKEMHVWISSSVLNIAKWIQHKIDSAELDWQNGKVSDGTDELSEAYINGLLSDEEYKNYKKAGAMSEGYHRYVQKRREDKVGYANMIALHHRAFAAEIDERIDELVGAPRPKKAKRPRVYGYDPRRNRSKNNQPRYDWQKSRKEREQGDSEAKIHSEEE